jgi:hypothetical protein
MESWLFPFAPRVAVAVIGGVVEHPAQLPPTVVGLVHPLIIATALAIGVHLARLARPRLGADQLLAGVALAFLLRCTLDTETMPYYHAPLFATLLAWDAINGERLPYRALTAAAAGYALFDRLTVNVISANLSSWIYAAVTLAAAAVLAGGLGRRPERARRWPGPEVAASGS